LREVPTPLPLTGNCSIDVTTRAPGGNIWELSVNLSKFTRNPPYNVSVLTVPSDLPYYNLVYSACNDTMCPSGYDCQGDQTATVYLCEPWRDDRWPVCTAFGIAEKGVEVELRGGYIFNGFTARYQAHGSYHATVVWTCNSSASDLVFGSFIGADGTHVAFQVSVADVCPKGEGPTPTPPPRDNIPQKPRRPSDPTPTAIPSPNAIRVQANDTHYIVIDLVKLQQQRPLDAQQTLMIRGKMSEVRTLWWAWDQVPPPGGYAIGGDLTAANAWVCWSDENFNPYCHPIASKFIPGYEVEVNSNDSGSGIHIKYPGAWSTKMQIKVACSPYIRDSALDLSGSDIVVTDAQPGQIFSFTGTSHHACPRRFADAVIPDAPRGSPPGSASAVSQLNQAVGSGEHVWLNLKRIKQINGIVPLGTPDRDEYVRSELHFSPWELIGCPGGRKCPEYPGEKANVWKCVRLDSNATCYPIGDRRWGQSMELINSEHSLHGIRVNYSGGAGGYSSHFVFYCDEDGAVGAMGFDSAGRDTNQSTNGVMSINIHTLEVCPITEWGQVTGGGVFLLIVFLLVFVYFGVGTFINYIRSGAVAIPQEGLWVEVWDSFVASISFIADCGAKEPYYNRMQGLKDMEEPATGGSEYT
jgi:hypothetical protein